jgi:hypothetical protein
MHTTTEIDSARQQGRDEAEVGGIYLEQADGLEGDQAPTISTSPWAKLMRPRMP